jgi:tetratricopeptide (TPR) repeat protein
MFTRYTSHGSVQDLQDIIVLHRRVLHSMSLQGVRHFVSLNHLAEALRERWYQLTQMNDIEESISLLEEALGLYTSRDERRAIMLGNLAQALVYLNMQSTVASRYSSAISLLREALSIAPLHNNVSAILQTRLSYALIRYYAASEGKVSDLQEAVEVGRIATSLLPVGHRDRPDALQSLAVSLWVTEGRNAGAGAKNYLEGARMLLYQVLDIQSPTHPHRASCLSILGFLLVSAYNHGESGKAGIDQGIRLLQQAITLVTTSQIIYPSAFNHLSVGFKARFHRLPHNRKDLDYSIILQEQAMNARPLSDGNRYNSVLNLANALETRYKHFNDPADFRRAISLGREALMLCPPGHHDHMCSVLVLSKRLILNPKSSITDIDEMVRLLEAILEDEYKPEANRRLGKSLPLGGMATLLHARFLRSSNFRDLTRSTELFEAAVQDQYSNFGTRFLLAKRWISAVESLDFPEMAMHAYRMAIHISPYRIYPGLDLSSQLDQLKRDSAAISCDAACCALVTADASEALSLLEQGRATFWAQRLQLRMSFDALSSDLADKLCSAAKKLQGYHLHKKAQNASGEQHSLEQRLHYEAFQQLLQEARLHPGFIDFLRPIEIEKLAETIETGFLIVLLSSKKYGSFAIIIRGRCSMVEKLSLSSITTDDLQAMVEELQVSVYWARQEMRNAASGEYGRLKFGKDKPGRKKAPNTMAKLWSKVGEPIMRHLGIKVCAQESKIITIHITQTVLSDAHHWTPGHECGGAVLDLSLHCLSMQQDCQDPTQNICQITSSHHTHLLSAVLSRQENK